MPPMPNMQMPPLGLPSFLPPEMQRGMPRPLRNITNRAELPQTMPGMMPASNKVILYKLELYVIVFEICLLCNYHF